MSSDHTIFPEGDSLRSGASSILAEWLVLRGIDLSNWGKGSAKTVDNLQHEIEEGEIILQDNPPLRIVHVAQVLVVRGNKVLVESEQLLGDGRVRIRNRPPSEKMKPGEKYNDAAIRCLQEELNVSTQAIRILEYTYLCSTSELYSPSYPGLKTKYTIHSVDATVQGLPDTAFCTTEKHPDGDVDVTRHHWRWVYRHELLDTSSS